MRGKYTFFLYDSITLNFISSFPSGARLSNYIGGVSKRFGPDIAKKLDQLAMPALCYGNYIIAVVQLTTEELINLLPDLPVKEVTVPRT